MTFGKSFTQIFRTGIYKRRIMSTWGISELKWIKLVYPSELLKTKIEVFEAKKSTKNRSKGTPRLQYTVTN